MTAKYVLISVLWGFGSKYKLSQGFADIQTKVIVIVLMDSIDSSSDLFVNIDTVEDQVNCNFENKHDRVRELTGNIEKFFEQFSLFFFSTGRGAVLNEMCYVFDQISDCFQAMSACNSRSELMLVREMIESIVDIFSNGLHIHDTIDPIREFSLEDAENKSLDE